MSASPGQSAKAITPSISSRVPLAAGDRLSEQAEPSKITQTAHPERSPFVELLSLRQIKLGTARLLNGCPGASSLRVVAMDAERYQLRPAGRAASAL